MAFQAYNEHMICAEDIRPIAAGDRKVGFSFRVRYPSYRGTSLSCIEALSFTLDGEEIPRADIALCLNGRQFLLDELKDLFKEYWFVLDEATIQVRRSGGLPAGPHEIGMFIRHRIPYTGYFGEYLVLEGRATKTLQAAG